MTSGPMPSPPVTPMRYGDVFTACGWCRKRDDHARRGRPRVCLRKRRNDLPELILGEGPERLRRDVTERCGGEREPGDDVVTRRLGDEDEVVPAEREIHALQRSAGFLRRVAEVVDAAWTVLDLRDALLRVVSERDERCHGYLPWLLATVPSN